MNKMKTLQRAFLQLSGLMLTGLLLVGCGDDCVDVCEAQQECTNEDAPTMFMEGLDCGDLCDLAADYADNLGCGDEWDELMSCLADSDPCSQASVDSCQTTCNAL